MTMSDPMYTQSGFPFCATGWWSCSVSSCVIVDSLQKQSPGERRPTHSKRNANSQPEAKVRTQKKWRIQTVRFLGRLLVRESIRLTDVSSYVQWFLGSRNAGLPTSPSTLVPLC